MSYDMVSMVTDKLLDVQARGYPAGTLRVGCHMRLHGTVFGHLFGAQSARWRFPFSEHFAVSRFLREYSQHFRNRDFALFSCSHLCLSFPAVCASGGFLQARPRARRDTPEPRGAPAEASRQRSAHSTAQRINARADPTALRAQLLSTAATTRPYHDSIDPTSNLSHTIPYAPVPSRTIPYHPVPQIPLMAKEISLDVFPKWAVGFAEGRVLAGALPSHLRALVESFESRFLSGLTRALQENVRRPADSLRGPPGLPSPGCILMRGAACDACKQGLGQGLRRRLLLAMPDTGSRALLSHRLPLPSIRPPACFDHASTLLARPPQINKVLDLKELVVTSMVGDKRLVVEMFWKCGEKELEFLVNSGLWFGFLLGIIQMVIWMYYDSPWTLTAGGAVVGYITNWLALKCIFEPVEPTKFGPFILQGTFLKRQREVSAEFADFFVDRVLTSKRMWETMVTGIKAPDFRAMLREHTCRDFAPEVRFLFPFLSLHFIFSGHRCHLRLLFPPGGPVCSLSRYRGGGAGGGCGHFCLPRHVRCSRCQLTRVTRLCFV